MLSACEHIVLLLNTVTNIDSALTNSDVCQRYVEYVCCVESWWTLLGSEYLLRLVQVCTSRVQYVTKL